MVELSDEIRRKVIERDGYRCQECGIEVGRRRGLEPNVHHMVPRSSRGADEEANLITLCLPCHSAKLGHTFMLTKDLKDEAILQYIKYVLWEISLNLLGYTDMLDPRRFPAPSRVLSHITKCQEALEEVRKLAEICQAKGIGTGEIDLREDLSKEMQNVEGIIAGVRIAWTSHYTARSLDEIFHSSKFRDGEGYRAP